MTHRSLSAFAAAAAILAAAITGRAGLGAAAVTAAPDASRPPQVLPDDAGKDVVVRLCYDCHDLMFTVSTRATREEWTHIVNDMRARGTDGTEEEFEQIIAYLTRHMGRDEGGGEDTVVAQTADVGTSDRTVPSPDNDAPNAPAVRITNGLVTATLFLPDPELGYYRATRFEWSGAVAALEAGGHTYFGRWNPEYDPKLHDAITGPVQEFVTGQGYAEAEPGETFIKVGVGVLRKPAEEIRGFPTLEIVDEGTWQTRVHPDAVEFIHEVSDPSSGYGYRYTKTVALPAGRMQMTLTHRLESTGANPIDTEVYNHNFFVLDGQPTGPDLQIRVPFVLEPSNVRGDAVQVVRNRIKYLKPVETSVRMELAGFSTSRFDYDIRVENRGTGAGVRVTSDRPLSDMVFWSSPTTACPEAYIHVRAERDAPMEWTTVYDFYSLPGTK